MLFFLLLVMELIHWNSMLRCKLGVNFSLNFNYRVIVKIDNCLMDWLHELYFKLSGVARV